MELGYGVVVLQIHLKESLYNKRALGIISNLNLRESFKKKTFQKKQLLTLPYL